MIKVEFLVNKLDLLNRTISGFQISSWFTLSWDTFPNLCLSQTRSLSIHLNRMYTSVTSTRFFSSISAWITLIPTFTVVLLMLWIMCFPLSYFEKIDSLRLSLNVFELHNVVINARKEISVIWRWYAPFCKIMLKMSPINCSINTRNLPFKQRIPKTSLPSILQRIVIWKDIQSAISQSIDHPYNLIQCISSISPCDTFALMMFIQTMKQEILRTLKSRKNLIFNWGNEISATDVQGL